MQINLDPQQLANLDGKMDQMIAAANRLAAAIERANDLEARKAPVNTTPPQS